MHQPRPSPDDATNFGTVLTRLRRAAGMTQEQLAAQCGLSTRGVGYLERGDRRPRWFTVQLLVDGLGLTGAERTALFAEAARLHLDIPQSLDRPDQWTAPGELVSRRVEADLIAQHVAGCGGPLLVVTGQSGIGKSRMLTEAAQVATGRRMSVLAAGCQRFGAEPYAPVADAFADYVRRAREPLLRRQLIGCASLARLLPELHENGLVADTQDRPRHTRRLVFAAVTRFLAAVAGQRGALLLLDDLQWASPDALALCAAVVRNADPRQLRVVVAYRDNELPAGAALTETVADLARRDLVTHLPLVPLPKLDAEALLCQAIGDGSVAPEISKEAVRLAGGLPLFLVQLGRAIADAGGSLDELPWGLTHTVRQQIGALPVETTELLTVLAVSQRRLDAAMLGGVCGYEPAMVPELLEPAEAARLLDETPAGFGITHDLVAEVIVDDLGPTRRQALHSKLAELLAVNPNPSSAALAYHYAHGTDETRAAHALRAAAAEATQLAAHDTAARYLIELVELLERTGEQAQLGTASEELAAVLGAAGRYDAALAAAERALSAYRLTGEESRQQLVIARIGHLHFQRGTPRDGVARIMPALTEARDYDTSPAQLHLALAANLYLRTQYHESHAAAARAIEVATRAGDEKSVSAGHLRRGLAARLLGDNVGALDDLHTAASLAELSATKDTLVRALTGIAVIHHYHGQLSRADVHFDRTLRLAAELGDREVLSRAVCNQGASALWLGDWKHALAQFERARDLARNGGSQVCEAMALICKAGLLVAAGEYGRAVAELPLAIRLGVASDNLDLVRNATAVLAERDLRIHRPARAVARLAPLLDRPGRQEWQVTDLLPTLADAYLRNGEIDTARKMAGRAAARARAVNHALALADALRVLAVASAHAGNWITAAASLEEALGLAQTMKSPPVEARVRLAWAEVARLRDAPAESAREDTHAAQLLRGLRQDVLVAG